MWRRIRTTIALLAAAAVLPLAVAAFGITDAVDGVYPPRPSGATAGPVPRVSPVIEADKPTVAIVLGPGGASVADVLAPYEVFARTGRFNVLTVAPGSGPVTLTGGLDVVPEATFDELRLRLPDPPDVIVVPQVLGDTEDIVDWLREQRQDGAPLLMSVCVGAEILAEAGLFDGRPATSHWLKLIGLRRSDPEVDWTEAVRFVDDGDLISTAGALSGVDGALRVVERLAGRQVAETVARDLHWSGYAAGGTVEIDEVDLAPLDVVGLLSAGYRWDRPETGVLLTDGVSEIELASAFRPYTELSYLARLHPVSVDGSAVRSRHGLVFLPRSDLRSATPDLDRVVVPGAQVSSAAWPQDSTVPAVSIHQEGEFPFDGALRDIARTYDGATARWVAKSMQYPLPGEAEGAAWAWGLSLRPLLLAGLGVGVVVLLGRRRRSRRRAEQDAAPAVPASAEEVNV